MMAMFATTKVLTNNLKTAIFSSIILATTFEFWYLGHAVITDGYLFLSSIGIFAFSYLAFVKQSKKHMTLAYISAALAVLAKGPVGIVLPGAVLLAFMLIRRNKKDWSIVFTPIGILAFFLVATPWYVAMYQIHGIDFITGFLGLHNYIRATVSEHPEVNVWYYYLALTPVYLLPWTGLTIYEWIQDYKEKLFKNNSLRQFQWLWFIIVILFYSIVATKYISYTFISLIPAIIMTAQGVTRLLESSLSKNKQWLLSFSSLFIFSLLLTVGAHIEPHINPSLMILVFVSIIFISGLAYKKLEKTSFPAVVASCSVILFLALAPTIVPVLNVRSAEFYVDQVEAMQPNRVYYFHDYDTSYPYYSNRTPLRVIDPEHLPYNIWDKGKDVMPSKFMQDMDRNKEFAPHSIFIVKEKYIPFFKTFASSKDFHIVGNYDRFVFFANYTPPKSFLTNLKK